MFIDCQQIANLHRLPSFTDEEKSYVKGTADFLALNFYGATLAEYKNYSSDRKVSWDYVMDQEMQMSKDPSWLGGEEGAYGVGNLWGDTDNTNVG